MLRRHSNGVGKGFLGCQNHPPRRRRRVNPPHSIEIAKEAPTGLFREDDAKALARSIVFVCDRDYGHRRVVAHVAHARGGRIVCARRKRQRPKNPSIARLVHKGQVGIWVSGVGVAGIGLAIRKRNDVVHLRRSNRRRGRRRKVARAAAQKHLMPHQNVHVAVAVEVARGHRLVVGHEEAHGANGEGIHGRVGARLKGLNARHCAALEPGGRVARRNGISREQGVVVAHPWRRKARLKLELLGAAGFGPRAADQVCAQAAGRFLRHGRRQSRRVALQAAAHGFAAQGGNRRSNRRLLAPANAIGFQPKILWAIPQTVDPHLVALAVLWQTGIVASRTPLEIAPRIAPNVVVVEFVVFIDGKAVLHHAAFVVARILAQLVLGPRGLRHFQVGPKRVAVELPASSLANVHAARRRAPGSADAFGILLVAILVKGDGRPHVFKLLAES